MTIECTIRFADPRADIIATCEHLGAHHDIYITGRVMGGFYFRTELTIRQIMDVLEEEKFEDEHFDNIEFKPV